MVIVLPSLIIHHGQSFIKQHQGLQPADRLPPGMLESLEGEVVNIDSWRGFPTLLVLFSSSCPACQAQIEDLATLKEQMHELNIVLVSIDGAGPKTTTAFNVYLDPTGEFLRRTQKIMVPTLYWIDTDGLVRYAASGRRPFSANLSFSRALLSEGKLP